MHRQLGERPCLQGGADSGHPAEEVGDRHAVEEHEPEDDVGAHAGSDGQLGIRGAMVRCVHGDHGARAREAEVEAEIGRQVDLHHPVDLLGEGADPLQDVRLPVVDHQIGARGPGQLRLGGAADRRDHPGARAAGELDGEVADRAGAARHQDGAPGHVAVSEEAAVGGHRGHPEAGAQLQRRTRGQRHRLLVRDHRPLGGGAPPSAGGGHPDPDALPHPILVDPRSHGVDHPGTVVVGDLELIDRPRRGPAP